jgi:hypothetical protein
MKPSDKWTLAVAALVLWAIAHAWTAAVLVYFDLQPFAAVAGGIAFLSLFPGSIVLAEAKPSKEDDRKWEMKRDREDNS